MSCKRFSVPELTLESCLELGLLLEERLEGRLDLVESLCTERTVLGQ